MKEHKCFLDSNVFLRPIIKDNSRKVEECEFLFGEIKQDAIKGFTSNLVLAEIAWVCKSFYKLDKGIIAEALKRILSSTNIKIINNFNTYLAIEIYKKHNVKFIDALIASNPQIQNKEMIVVSYDKDFDKLDIIRKEPKQIIKK